MASATSIPSFQIKGRPMNQLPEVQQVAYSRGWSREYISIARPDHWIKNVFMVPGAALALSAMPGVIYTRALPFGLAVVSLCLLASANYTINEFLDAEYDRFHPAKSARPGARGLLNGRLVLLQYVLLALAGCILAWLVNSLYFLTSLCLLIMGFIYNVPPVRTKDKMYLDVISESINNPIRFLLGWFAVTATVLPPSSVMIAYWMGGAFLMDVKRYSEYRQIADPGRAALYRRSFAKYTEEKLLLAAFFYAISSAFFIAIFLIKYHIELLLTFPLFAVLFTWYLAIAFKRDSAAQAPEKLYRETAFLGFAAFTFIAGAVLFFIHIPLLQAFQEPYLIRLPF
jgi:decaprenyl-phosphate phosphoribosyltransferase